MVLVGKRPSSRDLRELVFLGQTHMQGAGDEVRQGGTGQIPTGLASQLIFLRAG